MWCKPDQYLDHKNCACKNILVGRVIAECTNVINETMINDKDNITNDNTTTYIFVGLFSVLLFVGIVCFACLLISSGLKVKNYLKINILIIEHIKMDTKSLEIKTKPNYNWDDIVYINDFNVNSLEIIKKESRIDANIYYIGNILKPDYEYNTINHFYFVINRLIGYIEETEGPSDKYLVVAKSVRNKDIIGVGYGMEIY